MAIITEIKPQRRPGRYNIMVDDEFAVAVSEKVLVDLRLVVGTAMDEDRVREAAQAEDNQKALGASLRLLESRSRSQKEIQDRLKLHGYSPSTITTVTTKLENYGLVDDSQFAAAWVDSRSRSQPSGKVKLRSELLQKGVVREIIDDILINVTEDQELTLARKALVKKVSRKSEQSIDRQKEYTRLADYLSRRGFKWTTVRQILKERFGPDVEDRDLAATEES